MNADELRVQCAVAHPKVDIIIREISEYFEIPIYQIKSRNRHNEVVRARQWVHYFSRKMTNVSLEAIGKLTSKRDHSTVIYSVQKLDKMINFTRRDGSHVHPEMVQLNHVLRSRIEYQFNLLRRDPYMEDFARHIGNAYNIHNN